MHGWELSDVVHDTDEVAESLRFCGSGRLEQLDLSSTELSCAGLVAVMPAVTAHSHLAELDLSTPLYERGVPRDGLTTVCEDLGSLSCLQKLALACDKPEQAQATALASVLISLTYISELSLTVQVYDEHDRRQIARIFVQALQNMLGMQRLKLCGLEFGDNSPELFEAFRSLSHLNRLSLKHCFMAEDVSSKVVHAVEPHICLLEFIVPQRYCGCEYSMGRWPEWVVLGAH